MWVIDSLRRGARRAGWFFPSSGGVPVRSLSDFGDRGAGVGKWCQFFGNLRESGAVIPLLRPIHPKSDRLLGRGRDHPALQVRGRTTPPSGHPSGGGEFYCDAPPNILPPERLLARIEGWPGQGGLSHSPKVGVEYSPPPEGCPQGGVVLPLLRSYLLPTLDTIPKDHRVSTDGRCGSPR